MKDSTSYEENYSCLHHAHQRPISVQVTNFYSITV